MSDESDQDIDGIADEDDGAPPVQYAKISDEKRKLIINAIDRGDNNRSIARWLNVKAKTVASIRRRYEITGRSERLRRGGDHSSKMALEHVQALLIALDQNPLLTLKEMQRILLDQFTRVQVSEATVSRSLDK